SSALTDAGEHRHAAVIAGDPGDQLLNEYRHAHPGAAAQDDISALNLRCQQIDDFNPRLQHLGAVLKLIDPRLATMNDPVFLGVELLAFVKVQALAHRVEHAAERLIADGNLNGFTGVDDFAAAHDTVGGTQADRSHETIAEVLGNFQRQGFF